MIKVGEVYKAEGDINIQPLPTKVKVKLLLSHIIDNSAFLTGDFNKYDTLKEEAAITKIENYTQAIGAYLAEPEYEDESEIYVVFPMQDKELIQTAIGNPQFAVYHRQFLEFNQDLKVLDAYTDGVLLLRRIL